MVYILDTNVIHDLMTKDQKTKTNIARAVASGKKVHINGISYWEKKRGFLYLGATKKLEIFNKFCEMFGVLLLDELDIFEIASQIHADLEKNGDKIPDADVLIAAIALCKNKILITRDKHFSKINGLKIENWKS